MTRIFIALFALLGLAAQAVPAEARLRAQQTEVGVSQAAQSGARAVSEARSQAIQHLFPAERRSAHRAAAPSVGADAVQIPAVWIGSDRARE